MKLFKIKYTLEDDGLVFVFSDSKENAVKEFDEHTQKRHSWSYENYGLKIEGVVEIPLTEKKILEGYVGISY